VRDDAPHARKLAAKRDLVRPYAVVFDRSVGSTSTKSIRPREYAKWLAPIIASVILVGAQAPDGDDGGVIPDPDDSVAADNTGKSSRSADLRCPRFQCLLVKGFVAGA